MRASYVSALLYKVCVFYTLAKLGRGLALNSRFATKTVAGGGGFTGLKTLGTI